MSTVNTDRSMNANDTGTLSRYHNRAATAVDSTPGSVSATSSPSITVHSRVDTLSTSSIAVTTLASSATLRPTIHVGAGMPAKRVLMKLPTLADVQKPILDQLAGLQKEGAEIPEAKLATFQAQLATTTEMWNQKKREERYRKILGAPDGSQTAIDTIMKTGLPRVNSNEARYATDDNEQALQSLAELAAAEKAKKQEVKKKAKCIIM